MVTVLLIINYYLDIRHLILTSLRRISQKRDTVVSRRIAFSKKITKTKQKIKPIKSFIKNTLNTKPHTQIHIFRMPKLRKSNFIVQYQLK